ncbi:SAM-dependent DNA methyltransferase, partial [bacterium]
ARLARDRYAAHYSTVRLRELASRIKGSRHGDLWRQFQIQVGALSGDARFATVRDKLALPSLGSLLWNPASTCALNDAELPNYDFLESLRNLAFSRQGKVLRPVDYKNLGAEELGGVYESLLALTPQLSADGARFSFAEFTGSERKTSGSYYTPDSLVQCLLDSALDPVVEEAIKGKTGTEAEMAILALKVCDPAVGSGHFLVGAAHRLARHLARVRALAQGESEPSPLLYQHALRDVIGRCLYGVDINPMAAELCRVSLWLEALEPGKPLSFLDHHIRVGNSLLGTTPELIDKGIPDEAFTPIEGDDKSYASALKKLNKVERNQMSLPLAAEDEISYGNLADRVTYLDSLEDNSISSVHAKEESYKRLNASKEYHHAKMFADAWCAAFVWKKRKDAPQAVTEDILRRLRIAPANVPGQTIAEIHRLSIKYQFFQWHLEFPEIFVRGGFDCVLGNPPWEHTELKEKEWFFARRPDIAESQTGAERKRMIEALEQDDPPLFADFCEAKRGHDGLSHFLSNSGRYPLCGCGRTNLFAIFAEAMCCLLGPIGHAGCIVQSDIATSDTCKSFFDGLMVTRTLKSFFDFVNTEGLFPAVHRTHPHFCLLTVAAKPIESSPEFSFWNTNVTNLGEIERRFTLSAEDISLLSPNTRTSPIFRSRRDAELTKAIYRRVPVLIREARGNRPEQNRWGLSIRRIFNMGIPEVVDLCLQRPVPEERMHLLPMLEAKLIHQFDHRFSSYDGNDTVELTNLQKAHPEVFVLPRFWIPREVVEEKLNPLWNRRWLLAWRDITNTTNERTIIAAALPFAGTDFTVRVGFPTYKLVITQAVLLANWNALVFDYCARQLMGGTHLSDFITRQLPVLPPIVFEGACRWEKRSQELQNWLLRRVLELTYTAWDLEPFAQDCGWSGPPFRWDEERRFLLRCELDAAFFHLYLPVETNGDWRPSRKSEGCSYDETPEQMAELKKHFPTPRDAAAYIMDTFPIVKRKDEDKWGDYRTKRVILEIYDAMQESIRSGRAYQTRLDPPPADPRCCHPAKELGKMEG